MKILFVLTKADEIGGVQRHVHALTKHLIHSGHIVDVVYGVKGTFSLELDLIASRTFHLLEMKHEISLINDIKAVRILRRIIKKNNYDIVACHSSKAGIIGRLASVGIKNTKVVFTAHSWAFSPGLVKSHTQYFYILIEKVMGLATDKVIVVSEKDYRLAKKYKIVNLNKLIIIHNGVEDLFSETISGNKCLSPLVRIISIARFSHPKDFITIVEAINLLSNENIEVNLIGDGPLRSITESRVNELGLGNKINFLGEVNDVAKHLNSSDIFLLSSNSEGLPLTIIEAMSCKLPILASNVGGVPELIRNDYNGFLFEPGDFKQLASLISHLVADVSIIEELGMNSRETYLAHFDFISMYLKTINVYNQIKA